MGRPGKVVQGTAQPQARRSDSRDSGNGRLDPVRWHRPGRVSLIRLAAVAILLVTAAVVSWSPTECTPPTGAAAVPPNPTAAASPSVRPDSDADPSARESNQNVHADATAGQAQVGGIPTDSVGVPIRLADPTALGLVRPGNRIDLLRVNNSNDSPTSVATDVLVLNVTDTSDPTTGGLLLALTRDEASQAVAAPDQGFAILIRPD
jgi:hypothetical protein